MAGNPVMDGYIRVSQVAGRAGDRFQSPTAQRDAIRGWAKAHGVRIAKVHEDLDRSGGTMERPGMRAALERIEQGATEGIVVARLDRFARTVVGGLTTIHELHERGARVVSVAESIDPATPMGRAMLGLLLIMAEWQRDQADEQIAAAMVRANAAGRYTIRTPYGYRRDGEGQLAVDPVTAPVVHRIFSERARGVGWRKIAGDLISDGIPSPGGGAWAHTTLMSIVQSVTALGHFRGPRGGDIPDAWEPIVTQELWDAANAVHGVRDNSRRYHDRLFAGVARCAECRHVLKRAVNPHGFVSYTCLKVGCGKRPSIGAGLLDEHVSDVVNERFRRLAHEQTATDSGEAPLVAARDAAARELELWRDDLELRSALGERDYRQGLIERAKARDAAEAALRDHRDRYAGRSELAAPVVGAVELASFEWDDRRRIVDAYLHSVWVRKSTHRGPAARQHVDSRVRVVWRDDRDRPDLPDRSGREWGPVPWPGDTSSPSRDSAA